jgi:aminoglycoside 3-N-acetyltransferase
MGALTEFVRRQPGAVRSLHPFRSFAAVGRRADYLCTEVSRHAYGPETPKDRLLELDARYVSLGQVPRLTCSVVHHAEMVMGVPYRYTKEFLHPVVTPRGVERQPFYLYVWYRDMDMKRDRNRKLFAHFQERGGLVAEAELGRGKVYGYSLREFYQSCLDLMRRDIYCWLAEPPRRRPYQA